MSSAALATATRIAALRTRLADLGLSPDDDEVEALAAMEGIFHASLQVLRTLDAGAPAATGNTVDPAVDARADVNHSG